MPDIPTSAEFKQTTGRTGLLKFIKAKQDLDPIYEALLALEPTRTATTGAAIAPLRRVRTACVSWLTKVASDPKRKKRVSRTHVSDLLKHVNARHLEVVEALYRNTKPDVSQATAVQNQPAKPTNFRAPFVGKQLQETYARERALPEHWGPHVLKSIETKYTTLKSPTPLSMRAWAEHVYLPAMEDDPSGNYLMYQANPDVLKGFQGVKYCTAEERESFLIDVENGGLYDQDTTFFDTTSHQTEFSGFGWAIFVLGFDNQLYSASHIKNKFHHSSFFAGEAVQCGGEISVDLGKIRFLTAKTGHYQSDSWDFYRLLHFLDYHGVDLNEVLACPTPQTDKRLYNARQVFNNSGKSSGLSPVRSFPSRLNNPGLPF